MMHRRSFVAGGLLAALPMRVAFVTRSAGAAAGSHGLSLFGELKYGADFAHFDYANPTAPKGGTMKFAAIGTYDTLNRFVVKGVAAAGSGQTLETLMAGAHGEPPRGLAVEQWS